MTDPSRSPRVGELSLLLAVLLIAGAAAWWLSLRTVSQSNPESLDDLASALGPWQAVDIEMDQSVADMLNADHNVQRAYTHPLGYTVFVYVGYYGAERGGVPEHTPDVCYPSQGWRIVDSNERRVGGRDGLELREYIVEKEGARRLVHFWYRTSRSSGMTSILGLRVDQFWGRITNEGADGALIRLSTPLRGSEDELARGRLFALDQKIEAELERVWPRMDKGDSRVPGPQS